MAEAAPEPRLRLFVAVDVPRHVQLGVQAAADPLREATSAARWTDPASWHLTLAFLGWVSHARLEEIDGALAGVALLTQPFTLALSGRAGCFSRRVLWAGLEPSPELQRLAARTQQALRPLGFPLDERPFHAHLTLARARRDAALPPGIEHRYRGPTTRWRIERLQLMRSELRREGAVYSSVASWPLQR